MAEKRKITVSEYDAFGPWIYEVTETHPLPRVFVPWFGEDDQAVMKIKVPLKIERAKATPDMDLYEYVLALYNDRLRILHWQGTRVEEQVIDAKDFAGFRYYNNLLIGACTVFYKDGATSFSFNTVSEDLVKDFFIRALSLFGNGDSVETGTASLPRIQPQTEAIMFTNQLHYISMKDPDVSVGAHQRSAGLKRKSGTEVENVAHMIWKEMNPEALHLYTDRDLIILEHGTFPNRAGMEDCGYTYTRVLLDRITGIEITDSGAYADLKDCSIRMGSNTITYHFSTGNEEMLTFYDAVNKL